MSTYRLDESPGRIISAKARKEREFLLVKFLGVSMYLFKHLIVLQYVCLGNKAVFVMRHYMALVEIPEGEDQTNFVARLPGQPVST